MYKSHHGRADRLIQEKDHDPYREREKWPENTTCKVCGLVFTGGRWTWPKEEMIPIELTEGVQEALCPACQRTKDDFPAGTVEIKGLFFKKHEQEILNLIANEEESEKKDHPLERIMDQEYLEDSLVIKTTGIHIARRLGEALRNAYQGVLEMRYGDAEKSIRITWNRD
ncbi:hypothetical protein DBT_0058 [Dissulfuribacter thermophilus]|uniref:ATPase n=1 Tax=Dissulfuribacter thermophilus TaxID=1156395 RepID=A0A1B9F8Z0_9BACT|nr:BCAM0308 family protein [Dissulfuribacter thermophilus]OCC16241.1 hypothetical protein DBT_0058 [Dissulfuribacter thermophilus]